MKLSRAEYAGKRLEPKHMRFVLERAHGASIREAADAAGVSHTSGFAWVKQPWYEEALLDALSHLYDDPTEMLTDAMPEAWRMQRDLIRKGLEVLAQVDPERKVSRAQVDIIKEAAAAARDLMDRKYGRPRQSVETKHTYTLRQIYEELTGGETVELPEGATLELPAGEEEAYDRE